MKTQDKQSVHVMETYIKILESQNEQNLAEMGHLVSENLSLRETNAVLRQMVLIVLKFIDKADTFDGEKFKQFILTIENERLKEALEKLSNQVQLGHPIHENGEIIMTRPEASDNPPIIFTNEYNEK